MVFFIPTEVFQVLQIMTAASLPNVGEYAQWKNGEGQSKTEWKSAGRVGPHAPNLNL